MSKKKDDLSTRFWAGGLASGIAESITLPVDVIKVRLQVQVNQAANAGAG